jgi:pimeloyl-ACP methyl ester carboxylesterase
METVVDALWLRGFALLGMSQGAAVRIAYAERHPDRVTRLVLAGGHARGSLVVAPERAPALEAMSVLLAEGWAVTIRHSRSCSRRSDFRTRALPRKSTGCSGYRHRARWRLGF